MQPMDTHLADLFAICAAAGGLMAMSGISKHLLEWRRRRACPGCGRPLIDGRCGCQNPR
jgi:hypothetical protein